MALCSICKTRHAIVFTSRYEDGKRIDHIYKDDSLVPEGKIFFIGDSKYYSDDSEVVGESIHKQFTYAKNIIQYSLNIFQKEERRRNGDERKVIKDNHAYIPITEEDEGEGAQIISPVICNGDVIGSAILVGKDKRTLFNEGDSKMVIAVSMVLGKQMEN